MILNVTELSSEPIHRQVSRQVRARILAGDVDAGAFLPAPRVFARQQRVSAISVQRAWEDLAAEGWIRPHRDGRFEVAPVSEERRRDLAQQRLLETLREQEFSLKELELARDIQCRLLPPPSVAGDDWAMVARNEPARFVAGDFYDVLRHGERAVDGGRREVVDVVVADVAGKGIGPSLLTASVKAVLPFLTNERSVTEVFTELNQRLRRELGPREFVALCLARFEPWSGRLEVANAGLPDPYVLGADGPKAVEVPGERLPLGLRSGVEYRARVTHLEPGERLLMLSDGLPEADLPNGDPLGYERFEELLAEAPGDADAETWLEGVLARLAAETAPIQRDDWTAVVLERLEPSGGPA
ncbi:MAG: SpoIIE family protein phosphatase [Acidobacteriota bacterium]